MVTFPWGMTYISNIVTYGGYKYIGSIDGHDLGDVFVVPEYTTQRAHNKYHEHNDTTHRLPRDACMIKRELLFKCLVSMLLFP